MKHILLFLAILSLMTIACAKKTTPLGAPPPEQDNQPQATPEPQPEPQAQPQSEFDAKSWYDYFMDGCVVDFDDAYCDCMANHALKTLTRDQLLDWDYVDSWVTANQNLCN